MNVVSCGAASSLQAFCVTGPNSGPCVGDTGAPLVTTSAKGTPVQIGVASYGLDCGNPAEPWVFTAVGPFRDYIQQYIDEPLYNGSGYALTAWSALFLFIAVLLL